MSKIKNYPNQADETVEAVRSAIEFRATWFALLFDEMRKAGVDARRHNSPGHQALRPRGSWRQGQPGC